MTGIGGELASDLDWPDVITVVMFASIGVAMYRDEIRAWWRRNRG